jgi:hypothetical protein
MAYSGVGIPFFFVKANFGILVLNQINSIHIAVGGQCLI